MMRVTAGKVAAIGLIGTALLALAPPAAPAAGGVQLVTPYPAVSVEAGKSATFSLEVITPARRQVRLEVVESPPGWQATIRGGGFVVHGVFGAPKDPPSVQLDVKVPADAAKADYRVIVRAAAAGASDTLVLSLRVAEVVAGAVTLVAEFPTLRGAADTTFRFNLTLTNNTPEASTFNLSAEGPEGWNVQARPTAQQQAATVKVEGGGSSTIDVEADPPENVTADSYPVKVRAESGPKAAETTLTAEIIGNVRLTLTTPNERLNAKAVAGRTSDVALRVRNEGTTAVKAVKLSSSPPSGWKVTFSPAQVAEIKPKGSAQVTARITPTGEAVAGDYSLSLTASGEGASDDVELRVTVETSRLWGLLGLLVIAAAAGGLLWVFRQYGRR